MNLFQVLWTALLYFPPLEHRTGFLRFLLGFCEFRCDFVGPQNRKNDSIILFELLFTKLCEVYVFCFGVSIYLDGRMLPAGTPEAHT